MTSTWNELPFSGNYNLGLNWGGGVPNTSNDTALFTTSDITSIVVTVPITIGDWVFNVGADQYNFVVTSFLEFYNDGITIKGGSARIYNFNDIYFELSSSSGGATLVNFRKLEFFGESNASSGTIDTIGGGTTSFYGHSTGDMAQFITEAGGSVDFSASLGPNNDRRITAGSIAGAGTYELGADVLTVGLNGLSTTVSGLIDDGGFGGALVKTGLGKLTLSGSDNTYSGGTTVQQGILDLAAIRTAGTGPIIFAGGAKLQIENAALSGHSSPTRLSFSPNTTSLIWRGSSSAPAPRRPITRRLSTSRCTVDTSPKLSH
jgi:autotransporter-associated beta strand protein